VLPFPLYEFLNVVELIVIIFTLGCEKVIL
jgi:hypothetical protein